MSSQELVHRASPLTCTRESLQPLAVSQGKELWIGSRPILSPRPSPRRRAHEATEHALSPPAIWPSQPLQQFNTFCSQQERLFPKVLDLKKKKTPQNSWPWAPVPFPLLSGSFFISRPCPPPSDSVPTPTLPGQKLRFTLTAGRLLWGTGRRGSGCYREGSDSRHPPRHASWL